MSLINIKNLEKTYRTGTEEVRVLQGINLQLERGKTVVITGESGSGKSTFLSLIGGLDTVTAGRVIVNGRDIAPLSEEELSEYRSKFIGFIFQFHFLLKDFTAIENVMMPGLILKESFSKIRKRAGELLRDVGLERRLDHYPTELSGGERQRVAVARALMNTPRLILADEPTGNLDERNSRMVLDILFDLVHKHGNSMLLVTHDRGISSRSDEYYNLEHGKLFNQ
jgi:lipoprotein-releasing system ATP-binding protein